MKDTSILFLGDNLVIVTENVDGEMYVIKAKYIQDVIDDWNNDCIYIPANDAKVFFASYNRKPINPYDYTDFESLMHYLSELCQRKPL